MDALFLAIRSPFNKNISTFNDEDSYPDITLVIPGLDATFKLHRMYLRMSSTTIDDSFKGKSCSSVSFDSAAQRLTWKSQGQEAYKKVLVKWLRFCYGEDQTFSIGECPAALAVFIQLQLKTKEDIKSVIEKHMIDAAKKNAGVGTDLLCECTFDYKECHSDGQSRVDLALAKVVVTRENIANHPDIVDKYLMRLPPESLDNSIFGDVVTELGIRSKCVKHHKELCGDEKRESCRAGLIKCGALMEKCIEMLKMTDEALKEVVKDMEEERTAKEQAVHGVQERAEREKAAAVQKAVQEALKQAELEKVAAVKEAKEQAEREKNVAIQKAVQEAVQKAQKQAALERAEAVREAKEQAERERLIAIQKAVQEAVQKGVPEPKAERDVERKEMDEMKKKMDEMKKELEECQPLIQAKQEEEKKKQQRK